MNLIRDSVSEILASALPYKMQEHFTVQDTYCTIYSVPLLNTLHTGPAEYETNGSDLILYTLALLEVG